MSLKVILGFLLGLNFSFTSDLLQALPFKCEKNQATCEAQAKRWTVGDKVGVFDDKRHLIAIGEVVEIRGGSRVVKITQKWSTLLRNHEMEFIEDNVYSNPLEFFKPFTPLATWYWGASVGVLTLGVGDTFTSSFLGGELGYRIAGATYLTGNFHYISGSGKASDNLGEAGVQDVSVTGYGLSTGIAQLFAPVDNLGLKMGVELGMSSNSVNLDGSFDESKVLNNRIVDGNNLYFRAVLASMWRRDGIQPELGFAFTRIHQSNNPGIYLGLSSSIK